MKLCSFTLLIILFLSCKTAESDLGIIKPEEAIGKERIVSLSEIASTIKYIQLETNNSSLVGNITPIYYNNYFYVIDAVAQVCRIFDANGKYVGNLGNCGRIHNAGGPNRSFYQRNSLSIKSGIYFQHL